MKNKLRCFMAIIMVFQYFLLPDPPDKKFKNIPDIEVCEVSKGKYKIVYQLKIPNPYLYTKLDLYLVRINKTTEETKISKQSFLPETNEMKITFSINYDPNSYFDHSRENIKLIITKAAVDPQGDQNNMENLSVNIKIDFNTKIIDKKKLKYDTQMRNILDGAALYCDRLKKAAFHYLCVEKVVETTNPLVPTKRVNKFRKVNKFQFDYQLINNAGKIIERRRLISSKGIETTEENPSLKIKTFLTEKAVFGPLGVLARNVQQKYRYKFIKNSNLMGCRTAIIKALPLNKTESNFIYGKIWIDIKDYSVLKIKADPRSIKGYKRLINLAKRIGAKLFLTHETNFGKLYNGLRFPTAVIITEEYKGGSFLSNIKGSRSWVRHKTAFTYSNYKFFNVDVKVTIK